MTHPLGRPEHCSGCLPYRLPSSSTPGICASIVVRTNAKSALAKSGKIMMSPPAAASHSDRRCRSHPDCRATVERSGQGSTTIPADRPICPSFSSAPASQTDRGASISWSDCSSPGQMGFPRPIRNRARSAPTHLQPRATWGWKAWCRRKLIVPIAPADRRTGSELRTASIRPIGGCRINSRRYS